MTKTEQINAIDDTVLVRAAKRSPDGHGPFSRTDMLLAELIDAVNRNTYILRLANTDRSKARSVKPFDPYPRPGIARLRRRSGAASAQAQGALAYARANRGALPGGWVNVQGPQQPQG